MPVVGPASAFSIYTTAERESLEHYLEKGLPLLVAEEGERAEPGHRGRNEPREGHECVLDDKCGDLRNGGQRVCCMEVCREGHFAYSLGIAIGEVDCDGASDRLAIEDLQSII